MLSGSLPIPGLQSGHLHCRTIPAPHPMRTKQGRIQEALTQTSPELKSSSPAAPEGLAMCLAGAVQGLSLPPSKSLPGPTARLFLLLAGLLPAFFSLSVLTFFLFELPFRLALGPANSVTTKSPSGHMTPGPPTPSSTASLKTLHAPNPPLKSGSE